MSDTPHETPLWHLNETSRKMRESLEKSSFAAPAGYAANVDNPTLAFMHNATLALIKALERCNAPKDVIAALTESGDLEHVIWWLDQPHNGELSDRTPKT